MPKTSNQLSEKLVKAAKVVTSAVVLLSERYTIFHEHMHTALTHLTQAKKQFRTYNKQLRGYLRPKAQKELVKLLRKFTAEQKKHPLPLKHTIKEFYSLLQQLTKAISSIEKQLKKEHAEWTTAHDRFIQEVLAQLTQLDENAKYSESNQQKAISHYMNTERYSPAICEAYVHTWLKRCNEDYIDIAFGDCKELTKLGYEACRALYETDKITKQQFDDSIGVTREGHNKTTALLAQIKQLQPVT